MTAILGLLSGLGLIAVAMMLGGSAAAFLNAAGLLIVVFGTIAVTAISFSPEDWSALPKALNELLFGVREEPKQAAHYALQLAERARRDGILKLPRKAKVANETLLSKAITMLADGIEPHEIERTLEYESWAASSRHRRTAEMLRRAGEVAPAMGLIGTLIGLVQLLGKLNDPAAIGPAMAVALLTTFYGAVLAHMVFLPLAAKADRTRESEQLVNNVYTLAAASISRQENPRRLETALNAILPPNKQIQYF